MVENGEYIAPSTPDMLEDVKITTFESAQHYFLAVSDSGQVYSWGENSGGTCQVVNVYIIESYSFRVICCFMLMLYSWDMSKLHFREFQSWCQTCLMF